MKHKTALRKGLVRVTLDRDDVPADTPILSGARAVGTLTSVAGRQGIAYLRFDRASDLHDADGVRIAVHPDDLPAGQPAD